jgi:hypothetical protein
MKFSLAGTLASVAFAVLLVALPGASQTPAAPPKPQTQTAGGQVIFSRSTDENGQTTTQAGPAAARPTIQMATAPSVEDADRRAVTYTALDLDVRLHTAAQQIAVRALLTVRNDSKAPLPRIPLQISSSLNWEQIRVGGKTVSFPVATLNSDTDHTGQLHEAAVPLAAPLAPGQSIQLDVMYSGVVAPSAQRLLSVGTPEDLALHSDWDQIGVSFTGLRGFGNVVWYPVSSVPVILGDGARLFDEIGAHKLRLSGAHFRLHLAIEFPHGQPPSVALINGQPVPLSVTDKGGLDPDLAGVATASLDGATLGFDTPSLFLAVRTAHSGPNVTAFALPENEVAVQSWTTAAAAVTSFLSGWLGPHPHAQLALLDLPDSQDAPFETGALLAISLHEAPADRLEGVLAHALTHAFAQNATQPPPAWLNEGLAFFMGTLWVEKQHGRSQALGLLEADRAALALAEPASPGENPGQPLAQAIAPVYYRTKAAYVLWMLRDLAGDDALASALRASSSASDAGPSATPAASFQDLLKQGGARQDLSWFFTDWVSTDKGLPDLSIVSVFPNAAQTGTWLVAVEVANAGYTAADVPVTVRSALTSITERVLVPARGAVVRRILIQGQPTSAQVNDGTVPETQASVHVTNLDQSSPGNPGSAAPAPSQPTPPPR